VVARRETFGRSRRLQKPADFDRVFKAGRSTGDDLLLVYALPNGLQWNRLGIVAGRRLGGAVDRNRVKRLVREAFRTSRRDTGRGWDFVVIPKKIACKASFDAVKLSLTELAGKLIESWQD